MQKGADSLSSYSVLDLETSIVKSFGRTANPYDDRNYIVCFHIGRDDEIIGSYHTWSNFIEDLKDEISSRSRLVCHNAKFDIAYLWKYDWFQEWLQRGGKIWCTMVAEYLICNQKPGGEDRQGHYNSGLSLNYCSAKYGGSQKVDTISTYWKQGLDTKDIPQEELMHYNLEDVDNTNKVMEQQLQKLQELGMLTIANRCMEDLLCIIEMEYNGMYIDEQIAKEQQEKSQNNMIMIDKMIIKLVNDQFMQHKGWNVNSKEHNSIWFFGGKLKIKERLPKLDENGEQQFYKSGLKKGEIVTTLQNIEIDLNGLGLLPEKEWQNKKEGVYSTDNKVLKSIINLYKEEIPSSKLKDTYKIAAELAQLLLDYREEEKVLSTYYNGLLDLRYEKDGCVHPDFQVARTATGRLSCTKPNLQNQKRE